MPDYVIRTVIEARPAETGARRVRRSLDRTSRAADRMRQSIARAVGVLATGASITAAIRNVSQFQTSIAEIATIADSATFNIRQLTTAIQEQSIAFGSSGIVQARAAYDIISAGAANTTAAINTLTAANRLATAGITDVSTAADGLTSVLNAYGLSAREANDISDTLFVTVRAGKTTIDELSGSVGIVAPLAASAGISFQELSGAIAALTASGINTRRAATGIRAIISSIIAPSEEAITLAMELGVEFNAQGIAANGLAGVLNSVANATGGNIEQMRAFFPQVEALTPALALAANQGERLAGVLELMESRTGATDEAFEIAASTFDQQLNSAIQAGAVLIQNLLTPLLGPLGNALEGLSGTFEIMSRNIDTVVIAAGALGVAFLGGPIARGVNVLTDSLRSVLDSLINLPGAFREAIRIRRSFAEELGSDLIIEPEIDQFGDTIRPGDNLTRSLDAPIIAAGLNVALLAATAIGVALTLIERRSERIARLTQETGGYVNTIREGYDGTTESIERLNIAARTHQELTEAASGNVRDTAAVYNDLLGNQQLLLNPSDTARQILDGTINPVDITGNASTTTEELLGNLNFSIIRAERQIERLSSLPESEIIDSRIRKRLDNVEQYLEALREIREGRFAAADILGVDPAEVRQTASELGTELDRSRTIVQSYLGATLRDVILFGNEGISSSVADVYQEFRDGLLSIEQTRSIISEFATTDNEALNELLLTFIKSTEESENVEQAFAKVTATLNILSSAFTNADLEAVGLPPILSDIDKAAEIADRRLIAFVATIRSTGESLLELQRGIPGIDDAISVEEDIAAAEALRDTIISQARATFLRTGNETIYNNVVDEANTALERRVQVIREQSLAYTELEAIQERVANYFDDATLGALNGQERELETLRREFALLESDINETFDSLDANASPNLTWVELLALQAENAINRTESLDSAFASFAINAIGLFNQLETTSPIDSATRALLAYEEASRLASIRNPIVRATEDATQAYFNLTLQLIAAGKGQDEFNRALLVLEANLNRINRGALDTARQALNDFVDATTLGAIEDPRLQAIEAAEREYFNLNLRLIEGRASQEEFNKALETHLIALANIDRRYSELNSRGSGGITLQTNPQQEQLSRLTALHQEVTGNINRLVQRQNDLNILFAEGYINVEQYTAAMRSLAVQFSALDNTPLGGIINGLDRLAERANNVGMTFSDYIVNSVNSATDALVNWAVTGEFSARQFLQSLAAQLLRIATNQIISKFLLSIGFGGGGNPFGGGFNISPLPGAATGRSFLVGGTGGTDSQLVALRATPNERVTVETPAQQAGRDAASTINLGTSVNVQVVNNAPGVRHEVQQISRDEVRVIATEIVARDTDSAAARALSNPNSRSSQALTRGTNTSRRYG